MRRLSRGNRATLALAAAVATGALPTFGLAGGAPAPARSPGVAIFFYAWYSSPGHGGEYRHWAQNGHRPPGEIASDFYPRRGPYSSANPRILAAQMRELRDAGVDQIIVSWWGRGSTEDVRLPAVLRAARARALDVAVHLEPYPGRTVATVEADIGFLNARGIRDFFVYRAFDLPADEWARLNGRLASVRVFAHTGLVGRAAAARFDGIYTYDVLVFGGGKFHRLCRQAHARRLLCLPSVGPGYRALRATRDRRAKPRQNGRTYDSMWRAALRARADGVTITSYNEWHEGTQIEPARARRSSHGYRYPGYAGAWRATGAVAPCAYLLRTAQWARALRASRDISREPLPARRGTTCAPRP